MADVPAAAAARGPFGELPESLFPESFVASVVLAEDYGAAWAVELARRLELDGALAEGVTAAELSRRRGLVAPFVPALEWLLARLAASGHLRVEPTGEGPRYLLDAPLPEADLEGHRRQLLAADPANAALIDLLDAAGRAYPTVATGEATGEGVLLGPAGTGLWARYFHNDNPLYAINNLIAALAAANRLPVERPLTLLEVGAGGGSGTEALLREILRRGHGQRLESFLITEPSPFFRRRSERNLRAAYPDLPLAFADLDIDRPWAEQGVEPGSCSLVYGVNVFHVARDLGAALARAWAALAPGGWLVAGEHLRPFPGQPLAAEMVFRLLAGFNDVVTDSRLRPNPGFLTPEGWQGALAAAGFEAVEIVPDLCRIRESYPHFLSGAVCGRRPTTAQTL